MPYKIIHVIGQLRRGGTERQLVFLTKMLHERGWPQVVVSLNPGDILENELVDAGVAVLGIPRSKNKFTRLGKLQKIINIEKPAILHSWSNYSNVYTSWIRTSGSLPRKIASFRGNPLIRNWKIPGPISHLLIARFMSNVDCVISNSRAAVAINGLIGAKFPRVEIVGNFVPCRGRAQPGEPTKTPVIAAAGELIPLKAYDILLLALGEICKQGLSFRLLLAGDGLERESLMHLTEALGLNKQVKFLGEIDNVPEMLRNSHLLVHPSRSEGLSNTILEAMGEGLPVVASKIGGNPEIIEDGKTGILVPVDAHVEFAIAIKKLLISPKLRADIGKNSLKMVSSRYSFDSVLAQYEDIYSSVVEV